MKCTSFLWFLHESFRDCFIFLHCRTSIYKQTKNINNIIVNMGAVVHFYLVIFPRPVDRAPQRGEDGKGAKLEWTAQVGR